ncbi:MAG: polymerase III subunit beta protein [Candidatus Roizmanbacteria bacterium GW2011_GWA2_36_23]|uniref:Beta sliding clamp n=1 Tax=Candidatus Roizmanbacteria bacterium GW2011_GWA2_36_23 TaxID=1618480 RepID=A0A0G0GNX4_9BACT|nr:MAG: polymerase III subunit beta protein [Candidatus Roizmanbacteria bacterium GW2011_GWA2_36_23]
MKFSLPKEILLEKLSLASRFTSSKLTSTTLLQGVRINGEKNKLHLYSTNLSSYYHSVLKTDISDSFNIVIEPRKVMEFLSLLPAGVIQIEIKDKSIAMSQEKIKGEFPLFPAHEFPSFPKVDEKPLEIPQKFLTEYLPLVMFSASTDESRPILTGINFIAHDDDLTIVSTDGFRLSLLKLKKETNLPPVIVPSSFLEEVIHLLKGTTTVRIAYSPEEKVIGFFIDDHEIYTRLIDGEYPPYEKVIPAEKKTSIVVDKEEFLRNIKLISIFAREFSNIVIIQTTKDGIHIKPKEDTGGENVSFQEADVTGEEIKIAFNFKFLLDFLIHAEGKKITIELLRKDAPVVFHSEKQVNFIHIIMPVRIQEE